MSGSAQPGAGAPTTTPSTTTPGLLRGWTLPPVGTDKESRGRVLVVGGSRETPGAALLAAEAALRAGAGKLQVATACSVAVALGIALPEALVRGLPETADGAVEPGCAEAVSDLAHGTSALLVGPGLSDVASARALTAALLREARSPVVLDALALAAVTDDPRCLAHLDGRAVLTPNRGELALTLGVEPAEVEDDPRGAALELARRARAVVLAGGPESWTAAPDGRSWCDETGSGGLGVSGSGDVLAGLVCGLLARGAEPAQAAVWAAHLHGRAGDRLAAAVGTVGFLARELPAEVPQVLSELEV